jgi:hypothetical protein
LAIQVFEALFARLGFSTRAVFERIEARIHIEGGGLHIDQIRTESDLFAVVRSGTVECSVRGFLRRQVQDVGCARRDRKTGGIRTDTGLARGTKVVHVLGHDMNPLPHPPLSRARWSWLGVGAMVVLVLGLPTLFAFGPTPRRSFDEKPSRLLAEERPSCVLIGDSMLETRIDAQVLSRLSGERCHVFAQPGSSSATWFLMLKNFVAEQSPPPRTVIILFRGRQLTLPRFRAEGDYRKSMEPFMRADEPVVENLVNTARQPAGPLEALVQAIYPADRRREQAQEKVQTWALDLVARSREYEAIRSHAKLAVFDAKRLRVGVTVDEQRGGGVLSLDADDHDFAREVGHSFLPHILEIARAKKIRLVFYAVKRRPDPDATLGKNSTTGDDYIRALRAWLEEKGAVHFDETREADVTLDLYGSGDHIASPQMARYTELFWGKIAPLM